MTPGRSTWDHHHPVRIVFGAGRIAELPGLLTADRVLLVTSPGFTRRGVSARIMASLAARKVTLFDAVESNPALTSLDRAIGELRGAGIGEIVAIGGGSVIDAAKALSCGLAAPGWSLRAHLTAAAPLPAAPFLPIVAVPTTAGTGSEVTPFATVWDTEERKKYSLHTPRLFPRAAILDPALTLSLPREVTCGCGLDALSQAIESVWNRGANSLTLALAGQAAALAFRTLPLLAENLADMELRARMLEASLLAGLAISHTRTALAHAISYPLTAHFGLPHGYACAFTLPALLDFNAPADDGRLLALARLLGHPTIAALAAALRALLIPLGCPELLRRHLSAAGEVLRLVPEMFTPGRADNNLRAAQPSDVADIVAASLAL